MNREFIGPFAPPCKLKRAYLLRLICEDLPAPIDIELNHINDLQLDLQEQFDQQNVKQDLTRVMSSLSQAIIYTSRKTPFYGTYLGLRGVYPYREHAEQLLKKWQRPYLRHEEKVKKESKKEAPTLEPQNPPEKPTELPVLPVKSAQPENLESLLPTLKTNKDDPQRYELVFPNGHSYSTSQFHFVQCGRVSAKKFPTKMLTEDKPTAIDVPLEEILTKATIAGAELVARGQTKETSGLYLFYQFPEGDKTLRTSLAAYTVQSLRARLKTT